MTQAQQIALSQWAMYGEDGFPVHKLRRKWIIKFEGLWAAVGTKSPLFGTKMSACKYFNELILLRSHEWRGIA